MKIDIKKNSHMIMPEIASQGAAGVDITATSRQKKGWLFPEYTYGTNIHIKIPKGYVGFLFPRSSVYKTKMLMHNSVGIIDPDYIGELKFKFRGLPFCKPYKVGDRIGQLIIMKRNKIEFKEVKNLPITKRGKKGFGSTGS